MLGLSCSGKYIFYKYLASQKDPFAYKCIIYYDDENLDSLLISPLS